MINGGDKRHQINDLRVIVNVYSDVTGCFTIFKIKVKNVLQEDIIMVGWYYLHKNGDLIYKRELGGTVSDIRESDLAVALWPFCSDDRASAWRILVEGLASGVKEERIKELSVKWGCDEEDAHHYADRVNAKIYLDGDSWCATRSDFNNLQDSPVGFGDTPLEAMAELCKELGYTPSKMWGKEFSHLLK